jgi:putative oxidoreductase
MWRLLETDASWRSLVQRIALAIVIAPHGLQKTFGLFGGGGFDQSAQMLAQGTHLPYFMGVLAVLAESVGVLLLFTGFLTRIGALGITSVMIGAILAVHLNNGFFMNWAGQKGGEGFVYHLLVLALAIPLIASGGGRWSIDRAIAQHSHHAI